MKSLSNTYLKGYWVKPLLDNGLCFFLLFLDLPITKLERLQVSSPVEGPGSAVAETIPGRAEQIETCQQYRQVAQLTGKWVGWAT